MPHSKENNGNSPIVDLNRKAGNMDKMKHSTGKSLYHLLPWDALEEVAKVLAMGVATKAPNLRVDSDRFSW